MSESDYETGLRIRRAVLGDEYVDKALRSADEFSKPFQDLVTEFCWGRIWSRPGLTPRDRSLLNLAMLVALNRPRELQLHVRGALRNGCSLQEISETFLQTAVYCGVPAAASAFEIAEKALQGVQSVPEGAEARGSGKRPLTGGGRERG